MILKLTYIVRLSWTWTSIQFAVAGRWPEGFSGHVRPLWWSCRHTCRHPSRRVGCLTWVRRGCPPHRPYPRRCGTERWLVLPLPRNFSSNLLFFSAQCAFFHFFTELDKRGSVNAPKKSRVVGLSTIATCSLTFQEKIEAPIGSFFYRKQRLTSSA